jgi:hypothetical protein
MSLADIAQENAAADSQSLSVFDAEQLTRKHTHHLACTFDHGRHHAARLCLRSLHAPQSARRADTLASARPASMCATASCGARRDADGAPDLSARRARECRLFRHRAQAPLPLRLRHRRRPATPAMCLWKLPTKSQGVWSVPEDAIAPRVARADELRAHSQRRQSVRSELFRPLLLVLASRGRLTVPTEMSMRQCEVCSRVVPRRALSQIG